MFAFTPTTYYLGAFNIESKSLLKCINYYSCRYRFVNIPY